MKMNINSFPGLAGNFIMVITIRNFLQMDRLPPQKEIQEVYLVIHMVKQEAIGFPPLGWRFVVKKPEIKLKNTAELLAVKIHSIFYGKIWGLKARKIFFLDL